MRRTKADAQLTREHLLDAAETLFAQHGVSKTSLQDIAKAAGVTRGAVYWHFDDKADLFNAMMERTTLPMEDSFECLGQADRAEHVLEDMIESIMVVLTSVQEDPRTRRVFDIATMKVEYVGETDGIRQRHIEMQDECREQMTCCFRLAQTSGLIRADLDVDTLSWTYLGLINGLIFNWMLSPNRYNLVQTGREGITLFFNGLKR